MQQQNRFKTVAEQLGELRKEMLDLSLRNPLLNFRQPRGKGLELAHPRPDLAFGLLVNEERSFDFQPANPFQDELSDADHAEFQTSLAKEQLETRLLATYRAARTFIEEQGVNTLFLAFGMLRWRDEADGEFYRAPLVLVPVELERGNIRQPFTLGFNGEEIAENVSLIEKVKRITPQFHPREWPISLPRNLGEKCDPSVYSVFLSGRVAPGSLFC